MADAKKCDRCGKYYIMNKQDFKGCSLRHQTSNSLSIFLDLCDDCIRKLWYFMHNQVEVDDVIALYNQTKEDDECSDVTSTLDTTKMNGHSTSL